MFRCNFFYIRSYVILRCDSEPVPTTNCHVPFFIMFGEVHPIKDASLTLAKANHTMFGATVSTATCEIDGHGY